MTLIRTLALPLTALTLTLAAACGDDPDRSPDPTDALCDPVAQTGCPDDRRCTYDLANALTCLPRGDVPLEAACSVEATCSEGLCLSLNATAHLCYAFCATNDDCAADQACLMLSDAPFKVCEIPGIYTHCSLTAQDCPAATSACYAVPGEAAPICLPAGQATSGSSCTHPEACTRGTACVAGTCQTLCDPSQTDACGPDLRCQPYVAGTGTCATR